MPKKKPLMDVQPILLDIPMNGEIVTCHKDEQPFRLVYQHPHGQLFQGDSLAWLTTLQTESVDLIFADPPYNIKKATWDKFESQEYYITWSIQWIQEASRVLKKYGTLYICGFSEVLADLKHPSMKYFSGCKMIVPGILNLIPETTNLIFSARFVLALRASGTTSFC